MQPLTSCATFESSRIVLVLVLVIDSSGMSGTKKLRGLRAVLRRASLFPGCTLQIEYEDEFEDEEEDDQEAVDLCPEGKSEDFPCARTESSSRDQV